MLRATWAYLSAPREHAFWRFYFEIHGLALQNPDRYPDVLHEGVHDWLAMARDVLMRDGVPEPQAVAVATLVFDTFRGLILDLLQTGERKRVDAGFEMLATLADALAAAATANSDAESAPET
jgi:hypothetical protein